MKLSLRQGGLQITAELQKTKLLKKDEVAFYRKNTSGVPVLFFRTFRSPGKLLLKVTFPIAMQSLVVLIYTKFILYIIVKHDVFQYRNNGLYQHKQCEYDDEFSHAANILVLKTIHVNKIILCIFTANIFLCVLIL